MGSGCAKAVRKFLRARGLLRDKRADASYCLDKAAVRYLFYPEGSERPPARAYISEQALRDVFGARGGVRSLIEACERGYAVIRATAVAQYRARPIGAEVFLVTEDFMTPSGHGPLDARRDTGRGPVDFGRTRP